MQLILIFRQSGEVAGTFKAATPLDALTMFYEAHGWPPWAWVNGHRIAYDKNNPEHLAGDLQQNWAAFYA